MTGSRLQHLLRRNGTYYLRVRVPSDLQSLVGLSEVRRTLGVHILSKAKPLALKLASRVLETFDVLHQKTYSRDEARRLVQSCFTDLAAQLDHGFVPETDNPEMEIVEQRNAWAEATLDHDKAPHLYPADHPVRNAARALVKKDGRAWEGVTPASQQDILAGVGRAFAEAHRLFLFRLPCDPPATQKQADYCLSDKNGQQALFGNWILTITLIVTALATGASALGSFAQLRANHLTDREFKFNTRPGMQYSVSASFENWHISHPIKVVANITNAGGVPLNGVTFAAFSVDPVTHEEFLDKKAGELLSSLKAEGAFDEMMEVGQEEKWQVATEQPDFGRGPSPNWMICVFVGYKTTLSDTIHLSARAYYTSRLATDEIVMRRFGASKIYTS